MNDFLIQLSNFFQQAYVWVTSMCAVIVAIGVPSIVQVAKIFASAKLYLTQTKTLLGKLNACIKTINELNTLVGTLMDRLESSEQNELTYLKKLELVTFNKKEQQVIQERIAIIENDLTKLHEAKGVDSLPELTPEEMDNPKKRIKIKVAKE